ncbi:putative serine/threonine protein phosphatase [Pseudomonas phage OBP]|uniref:phosphoesterase n=1 Tax=Pseudomonas phage OBP TaxID=1124849 RepID=UPI000240D5C9|nr:phosphoesterase [Pseudomonas phage OBP]AEV89666.1 putative serine/threonine protein phosphatase [Pseudomonas phage OBP]
MNTLFWADGHVDHLAAAKRRGFETLREFQEKFADGWCSKANKNSIVYCVGDMALFHEGLVFLKKLPGKKILVMGNHDTERQNDTRDLLEVYDELAGFHKHKKSPLYIGHCPSHPSQLRGRLMVHGHTHTDIIPDERYVNVCWDLLQDGPVSIEDIVSGKYKSWRKPDLFKEHQHHDKVHRPNVN